MLKAKGTVEGGKPLYVLGLSDRNLQLLAMGRPIVVDLAEFGAIGTVLIFNGPTEEAMQEALKDFIPAAAPAQGNG